MKNSKHIPPPYVAETYALSGANGKQETGYCLKPQGGDDTILDMPNGSGWSAEEVRDTMAFITRACNAHDALVDLVAQAAIIGGIGQHEFSRPGGWLERAHIALELANGE